MVLIAAANQCDPSMLVWISAAPPSSVMNSRRLIVPLLRPGAADYQLVPAGLVVAFGLMQHSPALRCN